MTGSEGGLCQVYRDRMLFAEQKEMLTAGGEMLKNRDLLKDAEMLRKHGLALVQKELEAHGMGSEMHMIVDVVPLKREHPRLKEAHSAKIPGCIFRPEVWIAVKEMPVLDVEIFAGLLYTGSDVQGIIRKALREPLENIELAEGWSWTIRALEHLVIKLAERPPQFLYHGLNNVKPNPTAVVSTGEICGSYNNFVSGSMSLEMARTFAQGEGGTVASAARYGTVFHFNTIPSAMGNNLSVLCADMRWLSKFADEQEWLMHPTFSWCHLEMGQSRSEPIPGGELLHQECVWSSKFYEKADKSCIKQKDFKASPAKKVPMNWKW